MELPIVIHMSIPLEVQYVDFIFGDHIFIHNSVSLYFFVQNSGVTNNHALITWWLNSGSFEEEVYLFLIRSRSRLYQGHNLIIFFLIQFWPHIRFLHAIVLHPFLYFLPFLFS